MASIAYEPRYERQYARLPQAVARVMALTGLSQEQARIDICYALAEAVITFQAQLKRQANGPMRSKEVLDAADFERLTPVKPEDFDWEQSLPIRPLWRKWPPCSGFWEVAWIELSIPDITRFFSDLRKRGGAAGSVKPTTTKGQPAFDRAKRAIDALWPDGPPEPTILSNKQLEGLVLKKLKELGLPPVSPDTILRAAGRRRK
jgi:hypothetical protein